MACLLIKRRQPNDIKDILSVKKLCYILGIKVREIKYLTNNCNGYYYRNPKKDKKGKIRILECTKGDLNIVQKKIHELLSKYTFPEYMMGMVKKRSIIDNAKKHKNSKSLVTIDIKNCFSRITYYRVFNMFRNELNYSTKVASLLTKLTTYNGHVPQGVPCSSVVVTLCLIPLCKNIDSFCITKNLKLSTWMDDIAISGNDAEKYIKKYIEILKNNYYSCRSKKVKIYKGNMVKKITGIALKNDQLTIENKKISECKKIIVQIAKGDNNTKTISSLKGKIQFIIDVDKKKGQKIIKYAKKIGIELIKK